MKKIALDVQEVAPKPRVRVTADGLTNIYSGMGTANSQGHYNQWAMSQFMSGPMLDNIFRESWLAQSVCSIPAEDATRKWRRFSGENAEEIDRAERDLDVKSKVCLAKTFARLYGGAGILMLIDGQNLEDPLDLKTIKEGDLKKLLVFDRFDLHTPIVNVTDPIADNYLMPEYYQVVDGSQRIHWSRIIRFEGRSLSRRLSAIQMGWGDSVIHGLLQDLTATAASFNGIAELMQQANVDVIRAPGIADASTTEEESRIIKRYQLFNLMKSNYGLSLLDIEEELQRLTLQLTGVAPVQEQLLTWISGAAKIPVTRLFGTSAKGMNATGDGDERIYYDRISSMQESDLLPALRHLDKVLVRSAVGKYPDDTDFNFVPLYQLDDEEQANVNYTNSQTDREYHDLGIVKKSHIALRLQALDVYQITDEEIAELQRRESEEPDLEDDFEPFNSSNDPDGGDDGSEPGSEAA